MRGCGSCGLLSGDCEVRGFEFGNNLLHEELHLFEQLVLGLLGPVPDQGDVFAGDAGIDLLPVPDRIIDGAAKDELVFLDGAEGGLNLSLN